MERQGCVCAVYPLPPACCLATAAQLYEGSQAQPGRKQTATSSASLHHMQPMWRWSLHVAGVLVRQRPTVPTQGCCCRLGPGSNTFLLAIVRYTQAIATGLEPPHIAAVACPMPPAVAHHTRHSKQTRTDTAHTNACSQRSKLPKALKRHSFREGETLGG
eukprot:13085-Chlamydomonas_euryale.AAC.1